MIIIAVYLKNTGLQPFLSEFLFTTLLPIQHSPWKVAYNAQHFFSDLITLASRYTP